MRVPRFLQPARLSQACTGIFSGDRIVETYSTDIDPKQIVRWFKAECEAAPSSFRISARRGREMREIPSRTEFHLGDEEREDLSEIATIATLEIAPAHATDGWSLTIELEDEIGPRVGRGETTAEGEQPIDLGVFFSEFIRPDRGLATVSAAVEGPAARRRLDRLLAMIETNRHGAK